MGDNRQDTEKQVRDCYASWSETYYRDWHQGDGDELLPHVQILKDALHEHGASNVLDAGCGPASFLRSLEGTGIDCYGFDLTPEMIVEAKKIMAERGQNPDQFWVASILDGPIAKGSDGVGLAGYDAVVSAGVIPHIPESDDQLLLDNLAEAAKPGGLVAVHGRNQLFSLFTGNRYTRDFLFDDLAQVEQLKEKAGSEREPLERLLQEWQNMLRTDLPPIRPNEDDSDGYDEVLSRTHNPVLYQQMAAKAGLTDITVRYCNFHILPPMFLGQVPDLAAKQAALLEGSDDWRGMFMASSFVLLGRKADK